jgi:hypothetical protein
MKILNNKIFLFTKAVNAYHPELFVNELLQYDGHNNIWHFQNLTFKIAMINLKKPLHETLSNETSYINRISTHACNEGQHVGKQCSEK